MKKLASLVAVIALIVVAGCSKNAENGNPAGSDIDGTKFLLTSEPEGGAGVIAVRKQAKDEDDIVIVGRIGGSENPWIEGRAAFTIVDPSLKSCKECGAHDCPKPWDYC